MLNTTVEVELKWMPVRVTSCTAFIGPAIVKHLFPGGWDASMVEGGAIA